MVELAARMQLDALQNGDWQGAADLAEFIEGQTTKRPAQTEV